MNKNTIDNNYVKNLNLIWKSFKNIFIIKYSPWVNIVRLHPQIISEYLDEKVNKTKYSKNLFFKRFLNYIFENPKINVQSYNKKSIDILIISHLINKKYFNQENDFYFKNLQKQFEKHGVSSLFILRNVTFLNSRTITSNENRFFKLLLPIRSTLILEIYYILIILFYKFYLSYFSFKNKNKELNIIFNKITKFKILKKSISNLRLHYQFQKIIKHCKPKYVITTYEGHAWERVIYNICHKNNIKTIGYQFSILIKDQFSIYKDYGLESNPQSIYVSSKTNLNSIQNNINYNIKNIDLLGYDLPKKKNNTQNNNKPNNNNTFLFIPEGINSETYLFYDLALKLLKLIKDINIIFRCHAQLNFDKFLLINKLNFKFNKNFIISDGFLEDDIINAKYCVYRGTSAIIKAITSGCIPIYYNANKQININPLFQVEDKINIIDVPEDLNLLYKSNKLSLDDKVFDFSKNYFSEFNSDNLIKYIKNDKIFK